MFTCSRNEVLRQMAKAVSDYDRAESMVFEAKNGHLTDGTNSVVSNIPFDAPADLLEATATALTNAYRPMREALKESALRDMRSALTALEAE